MFTSVTHRALLIELIIKYRGLHNLGPVVNYFFLNSYYTAIFIVMYQVMRFPAIQPELRKNVFHVSKMDIFTEKCTNKTESELKRELVNQN